MELDNLEKLSTILQCAYCNTQNVMTFIPDELDTSEFICTSCEKKNTVKLQFVVARKTDMLQIPVSSKGVSLKDKDFE
jgi:transcription elongation factor Elf1